MSTFDSSTQTFSNTFETERSEPQGPVPAPCPPGGHSPARPSSSAASAEPEETPGDSFGVTPYTASYSPEDNKIRIRCHSGRFPREVFDSLRAAGYVWAPAQQLLVAPMWTPEREDLAIELAGELGDEDTTLVERAGDRAERFEGYSERRAADAESARKAVAAIADNIPLGQPILVGHHSERHARKDAERIRSGMERAVKMWKTSTYWTDRAAGAIRHAKYKEMPAVRARRIKTLDADQRRSQRALALAQHNVALWTKIASDTSLLRAGQPVTLKERVLFLSNLGHGRYELHGQVEKGQIEPEVARLSEVQRNERAAEHAQRWIDHLTNRLAYERAMLAGSGWVPPPKPKTKSDLPLLNYSGQVSYRNPWRAGEIVTQEAVGVTKAELAAIPSDYKGTRMSACGTHRVRTAMHVRGNRDLQIVYLTDSKQHPRPRPAEVERAAAERQTAESAAGHEALAQAQERASARVSAAPARAAREAAAAPFKAIEQSLKAGVQVIAVEQLFPTPAPVAAKMVDALGVRPGDLVLEPSAGTGVLVRAIMARQPTAAITAVELDTRLVTGLRQAFSAEGVRVISDDFAAAAPSLGTFDCIAMNPPFADGQDIAHILSALKMLKPGARLVALCGDGPRQRDQLKATVEEMSGTWESLGDVGFIGTSVRVAMLTVKSPL